jgi:hypothetical protein
MIDAVDNLEQEIIHLINQDNDPRGKAQLLILYRMRQDLVKNTEATINISKQVASSINELKQHGEAFQQLKGGWRVVVASLGFVMLLLGLIQGLGMYIVRDHVNSGIDTATAVREIDRRLTILEREVQLRHRDPPRSD